MVSWERGKAVRVEWGGNMIGKVCEWSEVAQWERWEDGEVAR